MNISLYTIIIRTCTCACTMYMFPHQIMCSNDDLKELSIPMGPRKKLSSFIKEHAEKERIAKVCERACKSTSVHA